MYQLPNPPSILMYADLFDQLGRSRNPPIATVESPPIVAFKAGVMNLQPHETNTGSSFACLADSSIRGQVRLIRNNNTSNNNNNNNNATTDEVLKWQFFDRRRDSMVFEEIIPPGTTFTKVEQHHQPPTSNNKKTTKNSKDRIFVWTRPASTPIYRMFWMQDADDTEDDEIIKTVNETLQSAKEAPTTTAAAANNNNNRLRTTSRSTMTNADPQVDTLSSILENLGMPAPATPVGTTTTTTAGTTTTSSTTTTAAVTTTTTNQLTLADLQGAMAGIQAQLLLQQQQQQQQSPDLSEIVTSEAITELIQDEAARERLVQFLPENQQTPDHLRDNLLSPSVRRSLALLSQALLAGGDSYGSVIANFQLDPVAGQDQLVQGNPIAAFLDCITASVQQPEPDDDDDANANAAGQVVVNQDEEEQMKPEDGENNKDEEMKQEEEEEDKDDAAES